MKKQYLPSQFVVGDIYRVAYTDRNGIKSKRNVLVTFTPGDVLMPVFCLTRRAYRTLTIASITKAKNITSRLKG